ncbi:hypothetical protein JMA_27180 [Jeotgalibacillus malaysiensis]|uniref:Phage capsid-like C-terminal domain-containing protein n=1 Tax=Jeotgalibacillus malaysiensis TaxID=1508404 RepID=A0A0B5AP37_9BACL|nr:phage major capsid protein [Jeotgalibacillus malaysiensis]AJD92035.1 hypothetical protein JMA_27180 [Jeotgalibacillus malaysiensis]
MNRKQYEEKRNALLKENDALIEEGKFDEHEAKLQEVEELDNKWEKVKTAQANSAALKERGVTDIENKSQSPEGASVVEELNAKVKKNHAEVYESAFAKHMMNRKVEGEELEVFNRVNGMSNAYTHDTGNTAVLIPETVVAGIWARAEEMYPFFADVRKYAINGTMKIAKHTSIDAGDASWYAEGTPTEEEQNTFGELILGGHELAKNVKVSWKLEAMAVEQFIPYIQSELGERFGVALGTAVLQGSDTNEPNGVETELLAEAGTPQVVTYDSDNATTPVPLSYAKLTEAIGKIHSSYLSGAAIYASNGTIWSELANLMDEQGRPLFIPDVTSGGVGRMFGMVVKPDAGVSAGSVLIGNANRGYVFNTNEAMRMASQTDVANRTTIYAAYGVYDGDVLDTKAFALIQNLPNA